ncbi:MAG: cellulase, partial [Bacteroidetes bacterium]
MKSISILASFLFASFLFAVLSCNTSITLPVDGKSDLIRINQLGYYPASSKEFVAVDSDAESFQLVDEKGKVHFEGTLVGNGTWEASGEKVSLGDFSQFKTPGTYMIFIAPDMISYPFEIMDKVHLEALNASIKSFYFQRASMPIEEQYGGVYQRASGHPDDKCTFHPATGQGEGMLSSPGGWYDAGDY